MFHLCVISECLTLVDEVLDDVLAADLHSVMQQRAAGSVLQQDVGPLLVELPQLQHRTTFWSLIHGTIVLYISVQLRK